MYVRSGPDIEILGTVDNLLKISIIFLNKYCESFSIILGIYVNLLFSQKKIRDPIQMFHPALPGTGRTCVLFNEFLSQNYQNVKMMIK